MGEALYKVTVSRVDEDDPHHETYVELNASRVLVEADGQLVIDAQDGQHAFASGIWKGIVIHPVAPG